MNQKILILLGIVVVASIALTEIIDTKATYTIMSVVGYGSVFIMLLSKFFFSNREEEEEGEEDEEE